MADFSLFFRGNNESRALKNVLTEAGAKLMALGERGSYRKLIAPKSFLRNGGTLTRGSGPVQVARFY